MFWMLDISLSLHAEEGSNEVHQLPTLKELEYPRAASAAAAFV